MNLPEPEIDEMQSFDLSWYEENRVMLLTLRGDYTVADAKAVNDQITEVLDSSDTPLILMIDAAQMSRPFNFQRIRVLQAYMNHDNLKHIVVVSMDKLVTLAMMVIFNMGRAYLHLYTSHHEAENALIGWLRQSD